MNSAENSESQKETLHGRKEYSSAKGENPKTPLSKHPNPLIRSFAKMSYTAWVVVMAVGIFLAFVVAIFLL